MVYEKILEGKFVKLRSITLDDAKFSYDLRRDPRFVEIMGQPAATLEEQQNFIIWQRKQPGDYYFVVLNKDNERIGLIGVYSIEGSCGEMGREINIGAPYETMEAKIIISDFCHEILDLKTLTAVVYKKNTNQLNFMKHRGHIPVKEVERSGILSFEYRWSMDENIESLEKARKLIDRLYELLCTKGTTKK